MPRSRRWADALRARLTEETGSASLEFITVGVLLLVPLAYLVLALAQLQAAAFAVEGAARHASRVFVQAESAEAADAAAERAIAVTLADYGFADADASVEVACRPDPDHCHTRRGFVTFRVTVDVAMPLVPEALAVAVPARIPMSAVSTEQVSRFWSGG